MTDIPASEAEVGQCIYWDGRWRQITAVEHEPSKPAWVLIPYAPEGAYVGITWKGRSTPEWFHATEEIEIK